VDLINEFNGKFEVINITVTKSGGCRLSAFERFGSGMQVEGEGKTINKAIVKAKENIESGHYIIRSGLHKFWNDDEKAKELLRSEGWKID